MFQNLNQSTDMSDWKAHEYVEEHEKLQLKLDVRTRPYIVLCWIIESFVDLRECTTLTLPRPPSHPPLV